jgi:hypothetical protein
MDGEPRERRGAGGASTTGVRKSRRWQSEPSAPRAYLEAGRVVADRYRISGILGEGGMGTVYRADHLTLRKPIALKVVRQDLAADPKIAPRFEREAYASSRLSSPHVVVVHDFGRDGDLLYLVMELLNGESLHERLERDGLLSVPDALSIAAGICRALVAAHDAGIVHRDLKPENVFLQKDGAAKVLDFGIARLLDPEAADGANSAATIAGMIVGTPMYMSPEMAANKPVGKPADLYALGVLIFEMIAGEPPYFDETPVLLMGAHVRSPIPSLRERCRGLALDPEIDALTTRLLAKNPDARGDAQGTLTELERLCAKPQNRVATVRAEMPAPARTSPAAETIDQPAPIEALVDATPAERGGRRAPWIALGLGMPVLAGLAALFYVLDPLHVARPGPSDRALAPPARAEMPAEPEEPPPPQAPTSIEVRFAITPADARITSADGTLSGNVLTLARDSSEHSVHIEAEGYEPRDLSVLADDDREIVIELARAEQPEPARVRRPIAKRRPVDRGLRRQF